MVHSAAVTPCGLGVSMHACELRNSIACKAVISKPALTTARSVANRSPAPCSRRLGPELHSNNRFKLLIPTASGDFAASPAESPEPAQPESDEAPQAQYQVFPRLREKDPYRLLGVPQEASFEEIQDARNFLYLQYKWHERSRESIEMAFDTILQAKMKQRHKYGFRPPRTGRTTDVEGEAERVGFVGWVQDKIEPAVAGSTLVNDGSIFVALGLWAAWQASVIDPTLPLAAAIGFCMWKLYDKRSKREGTSGQYMGSSAVGGALASPIWGSLATTLLGLLFGGLVSWAVVRYIPLPVSILPTAVGIFLVCISLGLTCIFIK